MTYQVDTDFLNVSATDKEEGKLSITFHPTDEKQFAEQLIGHIKGKHPDRHEDAIREDVFQLLKLMPE